MKLKRKEKRSCKKINLALIFGGRSSEHEVSIQSAKNVALAVDKKKYKLILIGIAKSGKWFLQKRIENPIDEFGQKVFFVPGGQGELVDLSGLKTKLHADVIFPVLHGPNGEDGVVHGVFKVAEVPFVGAGVLGSAVGMDKDVMKRLLQQANISVAKYIVVHAYNRNDFSFTRVKKELGLPLFIKPANLGSSIGISRVSTENEFYSALDKAFGYDSKIIMEEYIEGREIECAILGSDNIKASVLGEIIPNVAKYGFFSYDAKYLDKNGAIFKIPAKLSKKQRGKARVLSLKTFRVLGCDGMGRVDMFLTKNGKFIVNEINTIPGFTSESMYPKLWEASGLSYGELIEQLIFLANKQFKSKKKSELL